MVPGGGALVVVTLPVLVDVLGLLVVDAAVVAVVPTLLPVPGRHWEYHWLPNVHVKPETQVVCPVHPVPPPVGIY